MTPQNPDQPFCFHTESRLVVLTGRRAQNLHELAQHMEEVSGSSIFYHTHYLYLVHHFEKPRFYNDFANWVSQALLEERLGEKLAAVDLLAIPSIRQLREELLAVIRRHVESGADRGQDCPPGNQFHFCEAKSFVLPTRLVAQTVPELFALLAEVSASCLHFHFFEARLRLGRPTNDFSRWLSARGEQRLARRIDSLDPYAMTLDELKAEMIKLGRRYQRR